jgi:hypothetical protein
MNTFMVRWLKLSLVAIVGCGFLAMIIYAFVNSDEIRSTQIEPPLITPPTEALKRRPDQPGGMQLPNRDKLVFDLLDSNGTPITPTTGIEQTGMSAEAPASDTTAGEPAADANMVVVNSNSTVTPVAAAAPVVPVATGAGAVSKTTSTPVAPVKIEVAKPATVVAKVEEPKPVAKVVEKPKPVEAKPVAKGGWGVQLAAVGSKADGDKAAAAAAKANPVLQKLTAHVVATPDGKRYRVQFAGAKDRAEAVAVCAKVKPCFPVQIQ